MRDTPRPKLAFAAVWPAAMVPITLPVLRLAGAPDVLQGCAVGLLLGAALLLIGLSVRSGAA